MPDKYLHGNGCACPACELRHETQDKGAINRPEVPCNRCGGDGRLAYSSEKIIELTLAEDRAKRRPQ